LLRHGWRMPSAVNSVTSTTLNRGSQQSNAIKTGSFEQSLAQVGVRAVGAKRTRLTSDQASGAIRDALNRVTGEAPNEQTVALFTAQWAHETAHGTSMYNYNFGGIKGAGPTGLTVEQKTREGSGQTEHRVTDHFRAYDSAQDGANDYVKLLVQRYPEAVSAAQHGDSTGFVRGLKQRGYFTGDEGAYERSVRSISSGLLSGVYADRSTPNGTSHVPTLGHTEPSLTLTDQLQGTAALSGTKTRNSQLYVEPLIPTALASALSTTSDTTTAARNTLMADDLPLVSALSMADEVVRAALLDTPGGQQGASRANSSSQGGNPLVG
jgi:hypothetical protein